MSDYSYKESDLEIDEAKVKKINSKNYCSRK